MGENAVPSLSELHQRLSSLNPAPDAAKRPKYLFRGERCAYPTTLSYLDRYYHDYELYSELEDVTACAMAEIFPSGQVDPKLRGAYAQHYGLPTQIFDFTASVNIATFFACNRQQHERANIGAVGVLDVDRALASSVCTIFDIRGFADAPRAARQEAFGVIVNILTSDGNVNLKNRNVAARLGLTWHPFQHLPDDEVFLAKLGVDESILDTADDLFADIAQCIVDGFVATRGPLSRKAAEALARDIPAVGRSPQDNARRWRGDA